MSAEKEDNMVKRKITWLLLSVAPLFFLLAPVVEARGQDLRDEVTPANPSRTTCSLATLKGTYGVLEQGTVVGQLPGFPPPPFPVVNSATPTYDGAGNFSGTYTLSVGGAIVPGRFTGTYSVNPDCTYSDEFTPLPNFVVHHAGTITGEGTLREIDYIYTDAGVVVSGRAKKAEPWPCSLATLKGTYALFGQGTVTGSISGFPPPPLLFAHTGILAFDGKGNLSGKSTEDFDSVIVPETYTGTYTVNPDCTATAVINTSLGLVILEAGTITGDSDFKEVHNVITNAGWVVVDTAKKQ
jgi:hypothetical protein